MKDCLVVLLGQHLKYSETLLLSHALDRVKLLKEGGDGVHDDGSEAKPP